MLDLKLKQLITILIDEVNMKTSCFCLMTLLTFFLCEFIHPSYAYNIKDSSPLILARGGGHRGGGHGFEGRGGFAPHEGRNVESQTNQPSHDIPKTPEDRVHTLESDRALNRDYGYGDWGAVEGGANCYTDSSGNLICPGQ